MTKFQIERPTFEAFNTALSQFVRLTRLQGMLADGTFHHATYRTDENLRGLYIYAKKDNGFNGFALSLGFSPYEQEVLDFAYDMVRKHGVYEGSYR